MLDMTLNPAVKSFIHSIVTTSSSYRGCPPESSINDCCGTVIGATRIPESFRRLSENSLLMVLSQTINSERME